MNITILEKKVKRLSEKIVKYQNQIRILKEDLNVVKEALRKEKKNKTKNDNSIKKISGGRKTVMKGGAIMRRSDTRIAIENIDEGMEQPVLPHYFQPTTMPRPQPPPPLIRRRRVDPQLVIQDIERSALLESERERADADTNTTQ